jgi:N-6 DNA Methylase/Type ISP C-terminal specificity domain
VTFGLLVARARDIPLSGGIETAAQELRKSNSLIGTALRLLTEASNQEALKTSLGTLTRVLDAVDWHTISKDKPEAWLYFYEDFLEVYDKALRKRTGSYYTPPEVVSAMVNLVDEALRGPLFERPAGFAASDVIVADPAVGTGTFLLGVLRRIAATVADDQGAGAVRGAIEAAAKRIIGFEMQFGPFAVAQLRLIAELQALMNAPPLPELRLFITDTLGNPFIEEETLGQVYEPVAKSRRDANKVKKEQRITVVIGNPPYKNQAGGQGGWIESGSAGRTAPMNLWLPPIEWDVRAHAHHLKNLYVYFWRWATLKVFGSGWHDATGQPDEDRYGIVCFITAAVFLNGPGFQRMREGLRRDSSEIWVIDCSPEGHQPDVPTRIFQGVQQPVCIVLAARSPSKNRHTPGRLRYLALPTGKREEKFDALAKLSLAGHGWEEGATDWREPFLPDRAGAWRIFPPLAEFFVASSPGVKTHRTWVISPDLPTLEKRWDILRKEKNPELPDTMDYDAAKRRLTIGQGYVENVTPQMWDYEVSGKQVLWHWFSYRRRDRSRPIIGDRRPPSPLDSIQPDHWLPEYTSDLIDLLHVLGRLIALEPAQADLLNRICAGPLRSAEELRAADALALPEVAGAPKRKGKSKK